MRVFYYRTVLLTVGDPVEQRVLQTLRAQDGQVVGGGEVEPVRQSVRVVEVRVLQLQVASNLKRYFPCTFISNTKCFE